MPSLLQRLAGGQETVDVEGSNLRRIVQELTERYPGLRERLLREDGEILEGIAFAVDGVVATLGLLEPVGERSEIHIIPAVSGGSAWPKP